MKFDLPATGSEQSPAFLDAIDCKSWLVRGPLANAAQAQPILLRQLNLLHRYALPPVARFAILEVLRGPVSDMQENAARNFAGKPLPLATLEQAALERTLSVWHMLALGYLRCFDALCADDGGFTSMPALTAHHTRCAGNKDTATRTAVLAQRTLSVFADWQVDMCRGEQLPEADYWQKLNQIFAAAETLGLATRAVNDPVRHGSAQTRLDTCSRMRTSGSRSGRSPPGRRPWAYRWSTSCDGVARTGCSPNSPRGSGVRAGSPLSRAVGSPGRGKLGHRRHVRAWHDGARASAGRPTRLHERYRPGCGARARDATGARTPRRSAAPVVVDLGHIRST